MKLSYIIIILILSSCNYKSKGHNTATHSIDSALSIRVDSIDKPDSLRNAEMEDSIGPSGSLTDILKEELKICDKPILIDTLLFVGQDTFHILLKHHCLKDSPLIVPKKYTVPYKLDSFVTYNMATDLKILRNNKILLEGRIAKSDFRNFLDTYLLKYGQLLYPYVGITNNRIEIDYSISIPLTDVGQGFSVIINKEGKMTFKGAN